MKSLGCKRAKDFLFKERSSLWRILNFLPQDFHFAALSLFEVVCYEAANLTGGFTIMKTLMLLAGMALASNAAMASMKLADNGRDVECYGEDNQSWIINADRTTIQYTVEGESSGPKKITGSDTNQVSFTSFTTEDGTLTFNTRGYTYQPTGEEAFSVRCHIYIPE